MTLYEIKLRGPAARARNAYIKAASDAYTANQSVPAWLRVAHEKRLTDLLAQHYQQVIPTFGAMALQQIRAPQKKAFSARMADWMNREALRKAKLIAATDTEDVRSALQDGIDEGLGVEEIAQNIRKVSQLTPYRAATVARTETHAAATFGSIETVRDAEQTLGVKMMKVWLPTLDDRTRPAHAAMEGSDPIPLDEKFIVGGEMMDRPGDPSASPANNISCRCAIAYQEAE
jgi:uncharacterized protein with gpF-like domain